MKALILWASILFLVFAASKEPKKEMAKGKVSKIEKITENPASATSLIGLQKQIQTLSKKSRNCNNDGDCDTLPLGQKLCGGPKMHIIVSKKSSNYDKLKELSKAHTTRSREFNRTQKKGMFGTCSVVMAPNVRCHNNECTQKPL